MLAVAALFAAAGNAQAASPATEVACAGDESDRATLLSVDAATTDIITITAGHCRLDGGVALRHRLSFQPGAAIETAADAALTLSATPDAPPERIFFGSGAIDILAADRPVMAEWWGAKPDNHTDSEPAFQDAANAIQRGGTIQALAGQYLLGCVAADAVTVRGSGAISIQGMGDQATYFRPATNCSHFLFAIDPTNQSGNLRDFAIAGDQLGVAPLTHIAFGGIACRHCGVMDISNIAMADVGTALALPSLVDSVVRNIYIQSCAQTCLTLGGTALNANGAQNVCIDTFSDINMIPLAGQIGVLIDSGVCEIKFQRVVEAGAAHEQPPGAAAGIVVQNRSANGHRPEGLRFFDVNIDDNAEANLRVANAWFVEIHGSSFGTTGTGPSISIESAGARNDVDGFWLDSSTVRGAAQDGVDARAGCNLRFTNDIVDANGIAATDRYAGIRLGAATCGLVEIDNGMIGLDRGASAGWGNAKGKQAYGVILESQALSDYRAPDGRIYSGRLMMTGNVMADNGERPYLDNSAPPRERKLIENNLTK